MGLVEDDHLVLVQLAVALGFRQQNAVGHQLDQRLRPRPVGKAHLVADLAADRGSQLRRDPCRHRAGGDSARLGMADQARGAQPERQADFRQLGGLAGTRLAAQHDDLMIARRAAAMASRWALIGRLSSKAGTGNAARRSRNRRTAASTSAAN